MLSAIVKSGELKRKMIAATSTLPAGTVVRLGGSSFTVEATIGSGLVGTVYRARCHERGGPVVLKMARARFCFFREAMRVERAVSHIIEELEWLRPARILIADEYGLAKELCDQETLQQLLLRGGPSSGQRQALVRAMAEAAQVFREHGFIIDLSPKNLCWQEGWVLLDGGPKIHSTPFAEILEDPCFEAYCDHFRAKLVSGRSIPSVITCPNAARGKAISALRLCFVREWWQWFPHDLEADPDYFFVEVDESQEEDESLFTVDLSPRPRVRIARHADLRLAHNPIVQQCALAAFRRDHPHLDLEPEISPSAAGNMAGWLTREPLTRQALAEETAPLGIGMALKGAVESREKLPIPTLPVAAYDHWSDIVNEPQRFRPTDIYCHEPLEAPEGPWGALEWAPPAMFMASPPLIRKEGVICELACLPRGDTHLAILFVPGFRASSSAMIPLVSCLIESGTEGLFVLTRFGVRNTRGQVLVTAGRWETVALFSAVDYLTTCLQAEQVAIVAASHGAIAAVLVAQMHPFVSTLVLDSAVRSPLDTLLYFQRQRGGSDQEALELLRAHHLPGAFSLDPPKREGLRVLTLRPRSEDVFFSVSGHLVTDTEYRYTGRHAATMRHDSARRGIPEECVRRIGEFLEDR